MLKPTFLNFADDITILVEVMEKGGQFVNVLTDLVQLKVFQHREKTIGEFEYLLGQPDFPGMF